MSDGSQDFDGINIGAQPLDETASAESSRRSFIAKASVGSAVSIGAILGMSQQASAGPAAAASARQEASAEDRIISRASSDPGYRKRLIDDPKAVIGEEVGRAMPPGVKFVVVQETADTAYVVLPYVRATGQARVPDSQLNGGAAGMAAGPFRSWFRSCPCRCSSLSVCGMK